MAAKKRPKKRGAPLKSTGRPAPPQATRRPEATQELPSAQAEGGAIETAIERSGPPVAGIGASAGGLDAFKRFFVAMPAKRRRDGTFKDIAHPLNQETRDRMERTILAAYDREIRKAGAPLAPERPPGDG